MAAFVWQTHLVRVLGGGYQWFMTKNLLESDAIRLFGRGSELHGIVRAFTRLRPRTADAAFDARFTARIAGFTLELGVAAVRFGRDRAFHFDVRVDGPPKSRGYYFVS